MPTYPPAAFDLIRQSDEMKSFTVQFMLRPASWSNYQSLAQLNWQRVKFDTGNEMLVPANQPGLYSFVVCPNIADHPACAYMLYVGMTDRQSLQERYKQYLREPYKRKPRPHIVRMLLKWPDHLYFYYSTVPAQADIPAIETELIQAFLPPANKQLPAGVRDSIGAFI